MLSRFASRALSRASIRASARPMALSASSCFVRKSLSPVVCSPSSAVTMRAYSSLPAADGELVAALGREIRIENEADLSAPAIVDSFLKSSGFSLENASAQDEVHLVRKDAGETVHVYFSISDIANSEDFMGEEAAMESEESADSAVDAENPDFEEDFSTPVRLNIVIEKQSSGSALGIEAVAESGEIIVESMIPYPSASLALTDSAEADYKRRSIYQGPPFNVLDENVQVAVDEYLASRKIGPELAQFVLEYGSHQENIQYINWLEQIKKVVESA